MKRSGLLLRMALPLVVLGVGIILAYWLLKTGPQATPRPPASDALLVEVQPVVFGPGQALVEAMGTVIPAREVTLRSPLGGEVVHMSSNLTRGGVFAAGETLLAIDKADYVLVVRQMESEVAAAEAALKTEQGFQDVARREYEILGEEIKDEDLDLVLRKPQLETARARLKAARARLDQARLDLDWTVIRAPFPAVVQQREVNLGARVAANASLLTLFGTDEYWVEVVVPVQQLHWLDIPRKSGERGSPIRVYDAAAWGEGVYRQGRVFRLAADLEEQGRLARLLVAVDDPLGLRAAKQDQARLFVGSYVRVEMEGRRLESVATLDRSLLRDGDRVWIMNADNRLDIRPVEIVFRHRDRVLISGGIRAGERLVVTGLAAAVAGQPLRTKEMVGEQKEGE
jgi:RND family efflux transporter MFP subunit